MKKNNEKKREKNKKIKKKSFGQGNTGQAKPRKY
jgi:hypothetical protein